MTLFMLEHVKAGWRDGGFFQVQEDVKMLVVMALVLVPEL